MSSLPVLAAPIAAAILSAGCIRAIHPLLIRYALARPNARSSHKVPTPQGAGIAVIAATLVVAGVSVIWLQLATTAAFWVTFAATLVIATIGAVDDLRPMPVLPRLLLQAVCVAAVLFAVPGELRIASALPLWLERAVLLLAALWFINLVNFMDGLDWITVAEVVPVTAALALIGLAHELPPATMLIAASLGGAMLGFAPFNRPVAKMFLGDVGSLPIGLLLGFCFLELAYAGHLAAAILLPLYHLADATLTLLRRAARREPVWQAHRTHFYQRATDNGFAVIEVVSRVFVLNILLAVLAGISVYLRSAPADAVLLLLGAAAVAVVLRMFATRRR